MSKREGAPTPQYQVAYQDDQGAWHLQRFYEDGKTTDSVVALTPPCVYCGCELHPDNVGVWVDHSGSPICPGDDKLLNNGQVHLRQLTDPEAMDQMAKVLAGVWGEPTLEELALLVRRTGRR